jgi:lysophospholipase L1-like esterase
MADEEEAPAVAGEHHLVPLAAPAAEELLHSAQDAMTSVRGHLFRHRWPESLVCDGVHAHGAPHGPRRRKWCAGWRSPGERSARPSRPAQTDVWFRQDICAGCTSGLCFVVGVRRIVLLSALLSLLLPRAGPPQEASSVSKWEPDIRAFEEADRVAPSPREGILFVGSSSIRLWETLQEDLAGLPVINRGFGGSQIREVNAFIDRIVLPYRPRLVVFYAGTNDLNAGLRVERVFADYQQFVRLVHAALPDTRIAFISVAPNPARWHLRRAMQRLNREVASYSRTDRRLDFIDVWSAMLGPDGRPRPDIYVDDRLHMNEQGYAIWRDVVGAYVRQAWPDSP